MKKLFLVGAFALSTVFAASAQDLQGKWFVGGNVSIDNSNNKSTLVKTNGFEILPMAGTFISSDIAIGAKLGYATSKTKKDGVQTDKSSDFVIAPFARKYWNISGGLHFFGQAALPISFGTTEYAKDMPKVNSTNFGVALAPGFDYIVNDWFSIETSFTIFSAGYESSKPKGGKSTNSFNAGFNGDNASTVGNLSIGAKFLF